MDIETYQRPRKLSETTGIPQSTLAKMRLFGTGPKYSKIGRSVYYAVSDVQQWLAERSCKSTSEKPMNESRSQTKRSVAIRALSAE